MPALFVLPRQVPLSSAAGLLAGAKLTFSISGSSTLQNTYSDIALTVANTNPLIADGNGVFAKTYLDPSLPNYRVKLTTSANVLIYQEDDVPSNQNTSQQFRLKAIAPSLTFEETDASANNKIWRLKVNGEQLLLTILNDAEAVETTVFTFDRTGTTVDALNFAGQYLKVQGLVVATQESGSITPTLTGMSGATTGTVRWYRTGTRVTLIATSAITGTSNTTAMSMTGLGTLAPLGIVGKVLTIVKDNGVDVVGTASFTSNTIVFGVGAAAGNFTNPGTKGIPAGWEITYDLDQSGVA